MVDGMDGCVMMDGWMSASWRWMNGCVWVDEWVDAMDECVGGGGQMMCGTGIVSCFVQWNEGR